MIRYVVYSEELMDYKLGDGFFDGWLNPPDAKTHREILSKSYKSFVAIDDDKKEIVGFINVISDGVLTAYIPLLEVIPKYKNMGIGGKLVNMVMEEFKDFYMIDIICNSELVHFYEKFGMSKANGMIKRNYHKQSGRWTLIINTMI